MGLLGMTRSVFYETRPGEFWEALRAHEEEVIADRRHLGELVRGATLRLWNLQVKKENRVAKPAKFWPMPWDDTGSREEDEIKRLASLSEDETRKEVDKFLKRVNGKI